MATNATTFVVRGGLLLLLKFGIACCKLIISRVFTLCFVFLDIQICSKSYPEMLPSLNMVLEAQSLSPAQLAVKVSLIDFLFYGCLFLSFLGLLLSLLCFFSDVDIGDSLCRRILLFEVNL